MRCAALLPLAFNLVPLLRRKLWDKKRGVAFRGGGIVGKPCWALLPPKRATEAQDSTATMRLLSPHHRARARQGAGTFLGARKEINHLGETAKLGLGSDCIPASAT